MTEESKYVRFDWAIKRILRDKANKEVLEGLIHVLIGEPVKITEILESESNVDAREDKTNRVDVKAKTEHGEYIVVEVQLTKERDFFQRILFGTAKSITDQISISKDYKVIRKIYSINILYFNLGKGDDYAYHGYTTFRGMTNKNAVLQFNTENERKYIDKEKRRMTSPQEVFPEFFLLIVERFNEVAKTHIEEWMAYLKDGAIRDDTTAPGLQAAREKLAYMSMTKEERKAYDDYMVSVHAARDAWETAIADGREEGREEGFAEGKEIGFAEGKETGFAEGKETGFAEGKETGFADGKETGFAEGKETGFAEGKETGFAEGKETGFAEGKETGFAEGKETGFAEGIEKGTEKTKRESAQRMKADGMTVELIAKYTGLSREEIAVL